MITPALIPQSEQLPRVSEHWCLTRDGDEFAYAMARQHYSARHYLNQRQRLFMGPGRKLVLISGDGSAIFGWRRFICDIEPAQDGHNCAIFRNTGPVLSSALIREAVSVVVEHWGSDRCWSLVNPERIRSKNPGYCFIRAGWKRCGISKTGKVILEFIP